MSLPTLHLAAGLAIAAGATLFLQQRSDAEKHEPLAQFMARKLEHSKNLLAGLSARDLPAVAEHADKLGLLCLDLSWNVIQTDEYLDRSNTFRRTTGDLASAARAEQLERAQLAFLDLVGQCFSCHEYVRDRSRK